ncbi:hypothetical protein S2M10_06700 [Sphingomonas sp. S2M10]|uniref:hypothetical protein n=1 Tax=Sphingomonas sp. S2M10 TaxID=2705010 RepID=UPI0014567472|nr:hypothetical protein [Sphingomonas sp. S2M10]NLS25700.1 hypothetical protein [Sphingomonas sp. S2M10]
MGCVILWPATGEKLHRPDGNTEGYDIAAATVISVPEGWSWTGRAVDWDSLTIVDDLTDLKAGLRTSVCEKAEAVRNLYLTPGSGMAITYTRKEGEARAWSSGGDPSAVPFLAAEAAATGMAIDDLAALVIAEADAWVAAGSAIEARRRGLLVEIEEATTRAELDAIDIDSGWPGAGA